MGSFYDDFNGSILDTRMWWPLDRSCEYDTGEVSCFHPSQITVSGGQLALQARKFTSTCRGLGAAEPPISRDYQNGTMISNWRWRYGFVEARVKFCGGTGGIHPTFWWIEKNCQAAYPYSSENVMGCDWPNAGSGEVDWMEILGSNYNSHNFQIHRGGSNAGGGVSLGLDSSAAFHTYRMDWSPGQLTYKMDGTLLATISDAQVPDQSLFMIIWMTMNPSVAGAIVDAELPRSTLVDYITVQSDELELPSSPSGVGAPQDVGTSGPRRSSRLIVQPPDHHAQAMHHIAMRLKRRRDRYVGRPLGV